MNFSRQNISLAPLLILFFCVFLIQKGRCESKKMDSSSELRFENTNHRLLNKLVFYLINKERITRNLDTLTFNSPLNQLAKTNQAALEFRTFKTPKKIEAKINKNIKKESKSMGYKGGLTAALASEHNAINYEKGKDFFYNKTEPKNRLGLYYGFKKDLKDPEKQVIKIPNYSYKQFAKNLIEQLTKKQKKVLYNSSYSEAAVQINWYYKSLYKRKIPQMKLLVILGGYMTGQIRTTTTR